jgi:hypothetical protein
MKKLLLASFLLGAGALPAQDLEFGTTIATTLTAVRRDPDAFRNVRVEFTVQFASLGKMSNPFFTQFTPSEYANFYAWADEQPIWQRRSYDDVFGNLFYGKDGSQLAHLFELQTYQRMKLWGIVRNTFQGMPWIEVTEFSVLGGQLDPAALAHMYRGEQYMTERQWQRAIAELSLAPGFSIPPHVQSAAYKNLGICYLRIGESDLALNNLQMAASLVDKPDGELRSLLATAETQPGAELDRVVGQTGLKDYERPMWEAFESTGARRGR